MRWNEFKTQKIHLLEAERTIFISVAFSYQYGVSINIWQELIYKGPSRIYREL